MRKAKIRDGIVADIYDLSEEQFKALAGPGDTFVACSSEVCRGWLYAGSQFTNPDAPLPTPAQPKTLDQILVELDKLREKALHDHTNKWGEASVNLLWPLLKADCETEALQGEALTLEIVPSSVGYLQGAAGVIAPTLEQVRNLLETVRGHQSQHVALLGKTERLRNQIAAQYSNSTASQKLTFNVDLLWAEGMK